MIVIAKICDQVGGAGAFECETSWWAYPAIVALAVVLFVVPIVGMWWPWSDDDA